MDLKLDNIFYNDDRCNSIKIVEFGPLSLKGAKRHDNLYQTPRLISPE